MKLTLPTIAVACAVGVVALPAAVVAQDAKIIPAAIQKEDSAKERIALSGKLRMLSQSIPAAACHLAKAIDPKGAQGLLKGATVEFDKILNALEFGDAELNVIAAEDRRKTVAKIREVRKTWEPFKAVAEAIEAGDTTDEKLQVVLGDNMNLLESVELLVTEISTEYTNPNDMVQAEAMLIDFSDRQGMRAQKMSKESCMLASQFQTTNTADDLQGTMQIFELTLYALRDGMPEAGIRKPPTAAIAASLQDVATQWTEIKAMLETVLVTGEADSQLAAKKFQALNGTMASMSEIVGMYASAIKH